MPAPKFQLSDALIAKINDLAADLGEAADGFRTDWQEQSERWQDGDKGTAADAWIESLHEAVDALNNLDREPTPD